jgi:putative transposase
MKIVDLCRIHGISDATFYNWRTKYGGMEVSDAKRLKQLEDENLKLKHKLADTLLENKAIKDVLSNKWYRLPLGGTSWFTSKRSSSSARDRPAQ